MDWRLRLKKALRVTGYDVARFPSVDSLGAHLLTLLSRLQITCVLDIGAHKGEYGALLREIGYRGRIVSFEPVAASCAGLLAASAGDPAWSAHRLAFGREPGVHEIEIPEASELSSFLPRSGYSERALRGLSEPQRSERVHVRRLDNEIDSYAGASDRILLKTDTQGWDLEVLQGAEQTLSRVSALQVEASVKPLYEGMPTYLNTIAYLGGHGFDVTGFFAVTRENGLRLVEMDCTLVRGEAVDAPSA